MERNTKWIWVALILLIVTIVYLSFNSRCNDVGGYDFCISHCYTERDKIHEECNIKLKKYFDNDCYGDATCNEETNCIKSYNYSFKKCVNTDCRNEYLYYKCSMKESFRTVGGLSNHLSIV